MFGLRKQRIMVFEDVSGLLSTKDEPQSALVPDILRLVSGLEATIQCVDHSSGDLSGQHAVAIGEDNAKLAPEQEWTGCGADGQHKGMQEDEVQTIDLNSDRQNPLGTIAVVGIPDNLSGTRLTTVVELLEIVLINTDMQTVLCSAQRINKQFQSTIANSVSLQRMLYFLPEIDGACVGTVINPLLLKASVLARLPLYFGIWSSDTSGTQVRLTRTTNGQPEGWSDRVDVEAPTVVHEKAEDIEEGPSSTHILLRLWPWRASSVVKKCSKNVLETGSWQRMYLSQPPCKVVCTVAYREDWPYHRVGLAATRSPKTMHGMLKALWARPLERRVPTSRMPYMDANFNVPMWTMARRTK
ncbi:hypothetical protein LTS10_005109 [Elasticomyces elasticus]|nr:hypothetical protein LTS10_005109 [Elasticomyces elasticus]